MFYFAPITSKVQFAVSCHTIQDCCRS